MFTEIGITTRIIRPEVFQMFRCGTECRASGMNRANLHSSFAGNVEVNMGMTTLTVRIANPTDPKKYRELDFIIDSGASYTVVPKGLLKELGIRPRSKRSFLLANGEKFERRMGNAEFEYQKTRGAAPVVFGEKGDFPLLGVTTLEALGLIFDPLHQELKPALLLL